MRPSKSLLPLLISITALASAGAAVPVYEEVVATFGTRDIGFSANGRLVQAADGNLYGTMQSGGVQIGGTVFRITPEGDVQTIYAFSVAPSDLGGTPAAALYVGSDGFLYGSTATGSDNSSGSRFKMTLDGTPTVLGSAPFKTTFTQFVQASDHSFYAAVHTDPPYVNNSGASPTPQPNFAYGYTASGAIKFQTPMDKTTVGTEPLAPLIEGQDHNLYGTASAAGANGDGTVYRVTPSGVLSLVYSFSGADGRTPQSALVQAGDGNFYGTTTFGGTGDLGTVFRLTPGGQLTTLVSFTGANGSEPTGGLTLGPDGNLYGTTAAGGTDDDGTFYRVTLQGVFTSLVSFNESTGARPTGGVTLAKDGFFYGMTNRLPGTVYRVDTEGHLAVVVSFAALPPEGQSPTGIIQASDGNFYGSTGSTIFKMTPSGRLSRLVALDPDVTGTGPTPIVQGSDGALYGATAYTGGNYGGAVFKATLGGTLSVLKQLDSATGLSAVDFIRGKNGNMYGLTLQGGATNGGAIFAVNSKGQVSPFASLSIQPADTFFRFDQDADGNFYGTVDRTFSDNDGLAFKVTPDGKETVLASFSATDSHGYLLAGSAPTNGLTRGPDGNFYGTTSQDNQGNNFVLFRLTPSGTLSTVQPLAIQYATDTHLLAMADGSFFGTTSAGLFRATTQQITDQYAVFGGRRGEAPGGDFAVASDGYIYGVTGQGGLGGGVVYRFTTSPPRLDSFSPSEGPAGSHVILNGRFLAGVSKVAFNGVTASFTIDNSGQVTAVVPKNAKSGPISVTNALGTAQTSTSFTVGAVPAELLNISTRMEVQNGNNVLIGGFIVTGAEPKKVLIRALGPSLPVSNTLADPVLELHDGKGIIATNNNWKVDDNTGQSQQAEIEATSVPPHNDLESALIVTLQPSAAGYTAIVRGANDMTGVGQVEIYDLDTAADSQLANISTRGFVDTGDNVMIGGVIAGPNTSKATKILLRAIGPSLGISGELADPTLELHNASGTTIATNDNWKTDDKTGASQQAEIEATGVPPTKDLESALIQTVSPGNYTAVLRGKNNTTGIALVEAYNLE